MRDVSRTTPITEAESKAMRVRAAQVLTADQINKLKTYDGQSRGDVMNLIVGGSTPTFDGNGNLINR